MWVAQGSDNTLLTKWLFWLLGCLPAPYMASAGPVKPSGGLRKPLAFRHL